MGGSLNNQVKLLFKHRQEVGVEKLIMVCRYRSGLAPGFSGV